MENVNYDIACDVSTCKYNYQGCNCTLESIKVGCTCSQGNCSCCDSFSEKL